MRDVLKRWQIAHRTIAIVPNLLQRRFYVLFGEDATLLVGEAAPDSSVSRLSDPLEIVEYDAG